MDETGEEAPKQAPQLLSKTIHDSEKQPSSSSKKTSATSKRVARVPIEILSKKRFVNYSSHLAFVLTFLVIFYFPYFFSMIYYCELSRL
jgi:hypothetical protein